MTNEGTRRLEDLSVAELAALCGLEHDGCDKWTEPARSEYERRIVVPKSYSSLWNVWPHGTRANASKRRASTPRWSPSPSTSRCSRPNPPPARRSPNQRPSSRPQ